MIILRVSGRVRFNTSMDPIPDTDGRRQVIDAKTLLFQLELNRVDGIGQAHREMLAL